jgi:pyruvate kinase
MNLPGVAVSSPALTETDRADVGLGLELGVDYFALSFVRRPEDVRDLREHLNQRQANTPIIAKIEKPEALDHLDGILEIADGVMVARGDLGVELPPEHVPLVQQDLIVRARRFNKPVIVATQMLESMVEHPRPTRAEVSDVSTAVLAGADAVMLSAETSVGAFPVRSVEMMDRIARQMEDWLDRQEPVAGVGRWGDGAMGRWGGGEGRNPPSIIALQRAVARSLAQLSRDLKARAIVVRSRRGDSALAASGSRPAAPIVSMSMDAGVCRRLSLLWGVIPCQVSSEDFAKPQATAGQLVRSLNLAQPSDIILLLAGFGDEKPTITVLPV